MKIVFGGAFNPVTKAHISVYKYVMDRIKADEFLFLPVSNAYTKSELCSNFHRIKMLELATSDYVNIGICKLEMDDYSYLGTYQSLIRLSDKYNCEINFVVGADNLLNMNRWINIEGILSEFKIIVLGRNGIDIDKIINNDYILNKYKDSFIIFKDFQIDISSSLFRETFYRDLVDERVFEYIKENNLFRGEWDV